MAIVGCGAVSWRHVNGGTMATFRERANGDGSSKWEVQIRLRGHPTETATFERKTDAKKWAAATETAIREGRYFPHAEAKRHTVSDLVDRYVREILVEEGPRVPGSPTRVVACGARRAVAAGLDGRTDWRGPRPSRRAHPRKEWGWIDDDPMRKVRKGVESRGRVRFLDEAERARLLDECKK